jgi:putative hemolysin
MTFLEDAIEEIVGPIYDEFDEKQERIEKTSSTTVTMAGNVPLPEAANVLGIDFDEEADTVGGWLIAKLGRFPREGESVGIGDYRATVVVLKGNRIGSVRFEESPEEQDDSSDEKRAPPIV